MEDWLLEAMPRRCDGRALHSLWRPRYLRAVSAAALSVLVAAAAWLISSWGDRLMASVARAPAVQGIVAAGLAVVAMAVPAWAVAPAEARVPEAGASTLCVPRPLASPHAYGAGASVCGSGGRAWQAHLFDEVVGIYLARARAYDPMTGLFLQRDPEGYADSTNVYLAMAGDPVNLRDPTGRRIVSWPSILDKPVKVLRSTALGAWLWAVLDAAPQEVFLDTEDELSDLDCDPNRIPQCMNFRCTGLTDHENITQQCGHPAKPEETFMVLVDKEFAESMNPREVAELLAHELWHVRWNIELGYNASPDKTGRGSLGSKEFEPFRVEEVIRKESRR